jgi:hypothetical protein
MPSGSPDLDQIFPSHADPAAVDRARTRRLAARLFHVVRSTLALQPRREDVYIALDAVAWTTARILAGTEDRDALDFFALALTQNLADLDTPNALHALPGPRRGAGGAYQTIGVARRRSRRQ